MLAQIMSRPFSQGHRTSQSTSALSILASPSTSSGSTEHRRLRASQHPALGRVDEISSPASGSCANLPGLLTPGRSRQVRLSDDFAGREEVRGWLNDVCPLSLSVQYPAMADAEGQVKSLRSSDRRRLAALIGLERCLVRCCAKAGDKGKSRSSPLQNHITLEDFVDLQGESNSIHIVKLLEKLMKL